MLYDRKFFQYILDDFPEITNSKEVQTALQQKTVNGVKIGKPNETITSYLKLETFMLPELFNIAKERVLSSDPEIFRVKKKFLEKPSSKMLENTDFSLEEFIQLNTEEMKQTVPKEQWYLGSRDMAGIYYFFENDDIVSHVPLSSFISDPKIEPYIRIYVQVSLSYGGGDRLGDPLKREDLRDYIVSSPDLQKEIKNIIVTEGQCFYSAEDETQDIKSIFLTALEFASQEVLSSDEVQKILMKSGKGLDTYVSLKEELENEINEEKNNHFKNDLIATIKNSASSIDKLFNSNQEKYFFSVMSEEERRKIIESSNFQDAVKEGVYSFADAIEKSPYKGTALTNKFYDIVKYCATKETLDEMLSASPWVKVAYNGGNFNINNFKHK
jgi:hypothetical protein